MKYDLDRGLELLERTPATLESLLAGLSAEWLAADEGPDTWNPWDVVAHLTDLERTDWLPRVKLILEHGRRRIFDPIERGAFRARLEGRSIESLLEEFATLRRDNLETLWGRTSWPFTALTQPWGMFTCPNCCPHGWCTTSPTSRRLRGSWPNSTTRRWGRGRNI